MRLSFDSIEEVKEFVSGLKGTRGKKGDADEATGQAPVPMPPPNNAPNFPGSVGFAPPAGGAAPMGAGPFATGAPGVAPEVLALVQRINDRTNAIVTGPPAQPVEQVLQWFRNQCGAEAASATMDQIRTIFLPRMTQPGLEEIAKLINA